MKLLFNPEMVVREDLPPGMSGSGDRSDGSVYVYTKSIILAVNVALAARRPLLVAGPPGSGKSSLALNVARHEGWAYEEEVLTPRTQARDLLWRFDALRRLRDAQVGPLDEGDEAYVKPGVLWRAFEHDSERAVLLLDEIDKADPDVPNSLLEALGTLSFTVEETERTVSARPGAAPFVVLTTNEERELSGPFMRRCVVLRLERPGVDRLLEIARAHKLDGDEQMVKRAAERIDELAQEAEAAGQPVPSAAEFVDALRAAQDLKVGANDPEWDAVMEVALVKRMGTSRR